MKKQWSVLGLLVLFLFLLFLHWNSFNAPFDRDEGHYAYHAWLMTRGKVLYVDLFEHKTPLIYLPYLVAVLIGPAAVWPPRLLAFLSLFLAVPLLGLAAGREFNRRVGWISMWLFMPMIMFPYLTPFSANTEKFMLLPLVGLLAIYAYHRDKAESGWPWFWAGVCGALAILYKQMAILVVIYVFLVWLFENKSLKHLIFGVLGGFSAFILVMGHIFLRGGMIPFWEQTVEFNKYYFMCLGGFTLKWFFMHLQLFLASWPIAFILLAWFLVKRPGRWWFYSGLLLISVLSIFTTPLSHYFIMLMPFWAMICAAALDSLIILAVSILRRKEWERGIAFALVALAVISLSWPARGYYFLSPGELVERLYGPRNPFIESPIAARRVAEITSPEDFIFVAGSEEQIYFYAKRMNPSRFSGVYTMMMDQPKALEEQKELIGKLKKHPPRAIVFVRSPISWMITTRSKLLIYEYLEKLLEERYQLLGGTVRQGSKAWWEEPLRKENLGYCGLLLYKRK
jgi:4-amino-4-deoxy-L-arabinose transferase-like glycosyltransferase